MLRTLTGTLLLLSLPALAQSTPLTADAIMARVAANQDKSESARALYLYTQHAHIASRKGKTIRCEETTDDRITPTPTGSNQQLLKLDGRLLQKHGYVTYTHLPAPKGEARPTSAEPVSPPPGPAKQDDVNITIDNDDTMDRDLVENLRKNLTATHSKDGISASLFPLTSKEQAVYTFTLLGREPRNGRDSFHIAFAPKDPDTFTWKGDAWIDATAFQPIVIRTSMARKLPLAIRMLLGTNVPGLGFTIIYAPQPSLQPTPQPTSQPTFQPTQDAASRPESELDAIAEEKPLRQIAAAPEPVWFPTSFGTEFRIHVLFFFTREIFFNAENRDFHLTHTSATIHDAPPPNAIHTPGP
jgi:hypothetical protein